MLTVGLDPATLDHRLAAISTGLLLVGVWSCARGGSAIVYCGVRRTHRSTGWAERRGHRRGLTRRVSPRDIAGRVRPIVVRAKRQIARSAESAFAHDAVSYRDPLRTSCRTLSGIARTREVNLSTPGSMTEHTVLARRSRYDPAAGIARPAAPGFGAHGRLRAGFSANPVSLTRRSPTRVAMDRTRRRTRSRSHVALARAGADRAYRPHALAVVLGNLCGNAVQHAPLRDANPCAGIAPDGASPRRTRLGNGRSRRTAPLRTILAQGQRHGNGPPAVLTSTLWRLNLSPCSAQVERHTHARARSWNLACLVAGVFGRVTSKRKKIHEKEALCGAWQAWRRSPSLCEVCGRGGGQETAIIRR